jgi:hypothetical protein
VITLVSALRRIKTTTIEVGLKPTAAITAKVVDRQSCEPVYWACVMALPKRFGGIGQDDCKYKTDGNGDVIIGELPAATYSLLVVPQLSDHGIQWVGQGGGTGSQYEALQLEMEVGKATQVDPIRLDPPGTLSGVVRDAANGQPTTACASVLPVKPSAHDSRLGGFGCTDGNGRHEISDLGPYKWPVLFTNNGTGGNVAWQWSGGVADRLDAKRYAVQSGMVTTADARLMPAGALAGRTLERDGSPFDGSVRVSAFNKLTGDYAGEEGDGWYGTYSLTGLAAQQIKIQYWADGRSRIWYKNAPSWDEASPVAVQAGRERTLDLVVPPASN